VTLPGQSRKDIRALSAFELFSLHKMEQTLGLKYCLIDQLKHEGYFKHTKNGYRVSLLNQLVDLGYVFCDPGENPIPFCRFWKPSVDLLSTLKVATNVLNHRITRHAKAAKICHYLVANKRPLSGGTTEPITSKNATEMISIAINLWITLMSDDRFDNTKAKELWEQLIVPLLSDGPDTDLTDKKQIQYISDIILANPVLRNILSATWKKIWEDDDDIIMKAGKYLKQPIFGWYPNKKTITDEGEEKESKDIVSIFRRGTLAPEQLKMKTLYYRICCRYFTRFRCDGTSEPLDQNFGSRMLKNIEQTKDTIHEDMIHLIMMHAQGYSQRDVTQFLKAMSGKAKPIRDIRPDPSKQVHVIVIENLSYFKVNIHRSKQNNKNICLMRPMSFADELKATAKEHGILCITTNPAYTSQRCALTGAPGLRCKEVSALTFQKSSFYQEKVSIARSKTPAQRSWYDELILSILEEIMCLDDSQKKNKTFIMPYLGGPLFLSSDQSEIQYPVNADANASLNIMLGVTQDPDYHGKYFSINVDAQTYCPDPNSVGGSACIDYTKPLRIEPDSDSVSKTAKPAENTTEPAESSAKTPENKRQLPPTKKQKSGPLRLFRVYPFGPSLAESTFMLYSAFFNKVCSDTKKNMMALNESPRCRGSPRSTLVPATPLTDMLPDI
jgi:IS605 OrfB family transposase